MGLKFVVDRRVLIPRPETEILIEQVLKVVGDATTTRSILDIGTGSGNIAVSLAQRLSRCDITATDISQDALDVARINAGRNNVGHFIRFYHHDIFSVDALPGAAFDVVVSNPPYVSEAEKGSLAREILEYEPRLAILEGGDGLRLFRRIADVGKSVLKSSGWLFVEIAYNQSEEVARIFSESGYGNIQTFKDYSGNDRVVQARWGS